MDSKYRIEQDISNSYFNLIFFFTLMLLLFFFFYVTFVLSTKQPESVRLSQIEYDLLTNKSIQPELNLLGKDNLEEELTPEEIRNIYKFASLDICPSGQCVVDLNNGSKRCPGDNDTTLSYYPTFEVCSNPYSCDSSKAPFAERLDGSAFNSDCGYEYPCRCLKQPQCAYQTTSTLNNQNGSPYGVNNNQLNYYFLPDNKGKSSFSKEPLTISDANIGNNFCQLNPAFTPRIINGCNFSTNINDPLDCTNSNILQKLEENELTVVIVPANPGPLLTNNLVRYNAGDTTIWVTSNVDLTEYNKGFILIEFDSGIDNFEIYYEGVIQSNFIDRDSISYNGYILENISSKYVSSKEWSPGLLKDLIPRSATNPDLTFYNAFEGVLEAKWLSFKYQPCTITSRNTVNYKNMLECVQNKNQPCKNGILTYGVDNIIDAENNLNESVYSQANTRNFCQAFNKTRLEPTKVNKFYLNDPANYTTSCMIGAGCDGIFDNSLCEEENCADSIDRRKKDFINQYDESGVSNFWIISANAPKNYPRLSLLKTDNYTNIEIINPALFSLEAGDYWARNNANVTVYVSKQAEAGDTVISIYPEFLNSIQLNSTFQYPGYTLPLPIITEIDTVNNTITLNIGIVTSIKVSQAVKVRNLLNSSNVGVIGQGVDNNLFYLMDINGYDYANLTDVIIEQIKNDGLIIFKQFGFNGINYNTNIKLDNNQYTNREYSESFVYYDSLGNDKKPVYNYLNLTEINLDQSEKIVNAFNNTNANFKNKHSMYYPVWNNSQFRQECIMCKPNLLSFSTITPLNQLDKVQIQFSGKDFYNYVYYQPDDDFVYTTFTKITKESNTNYMIMEDINNNISVGDYIIDSLGYLEKNFTYKTKNAQVNELNNLTLFSPQYNRNVRGTALAQFYKNFIIVDKLGKRNIMTSNTINNLPAINDDTFNCDNSNGAINFFLGNYYKDSSDNIFTIIPLVKVTDIINNVIITDSSILLNYDQDLFIQTIKLDEKLELGLQQNIDIGGGTGVDAAVKVNTITDGRITDIKIINKGKNYSSQNKPVVLIENYLTTKEINILAD